MINAYAILTGYVALRGSMAIHLSMLLAMIIFVRVPGTDDLETSFPGGRLWYVFAAFMHLLLALLHLSSLIAWFGADTIR